MKTDNLKGRILFSPRCDTFFQFVSLFGDEPELGPSLHRFKSIDLGNGKENVINFLEDIGEELFFVPEDFCRKRINSYLKAAKTREGANNLMCDMMHEIILHPDNECN